MKYIHRKIEEVLLSAVKRFPAVAVTGPRQSGKSTLLKQVLGDKYEYVTFDDPLVRERCIRDPKLFLSGIGKRVILDEIQYVPQLLSYIKIAIDEKRHVNGRFVITGSQQFQLMKNLGDSLAGRIRLLTLLPFGANEYSAAGKAAENTKKAFLGACLRGSFPEPAIKKSIKPENWYAGYIQTYLERDVRGIYGIGSILDFQRFMALIAARCSQILNLSSLAGDLGVAVSTVKTWLSVLSASQIVYILPPYFKNYGKRIIKSPKVYFTDCGLVAYLTGLKTDEMIMKGPLAGSLFENYVIQETLKMIFNVGQKVELYYFRTHKGIEVDLLIPDGTRIVPYEIKLTGTPKLEMAKTLSGLGKISEDFDVNRSGLICLSESTYKITRSTTVYNFMDYMSSLSKIMK